MEDLDMIYIDWLKSHNFMPIPESAILLPVFQNDLLNLNIKWK